MSEVPATEQPRGPKRQRIDLVEMETTIENNPMPETRNALDRKIKVKETELDDITKIRHKFEENEIDEMRTKLTERYEVKTKRANREEMYKFFQKMKLDYDKEVQEWATEYILKCDLRKVKADFETAFEENRQLKTKLEQNKELEKNLENIWRQHLVEVQNSYEKISDVILKLHVETLRGKSETGKSTKDDDKSFLEGAVEKLNSEEALKAENDKLKKTVESKEEVKNWVESIENIKNWLRLFNDFLEHVAGLCEKH